MSWSALPAQCGKDHSQTFPVDGTGSQTAPRTCQQSTCQPGIKRGCRPLVMLVGWLWLSLLGSPQHTVTGGLFFQGCCVFAMFPGATEGWVLDTLLRGLDVWAQLLFITELCFPEVGVYSVFPCTTNKGFCAASCPSVCIWVLTKPRSPTKLWKSSQSPDNLVSLTFSNGQILFLFFLFFLKSCS